MELFSIKIRCTFQLVSTGKAGGAIVRNGYYRIEAAITGLVGSEVGLTITVADWESPVTQQIDLGA